jgi:hypothetical protein
VLETLLTLGAIFASIKLCEILVKDGDPNKYKDRIYYQPLDPGEYNPYTGRRVGPDGLPEPEDEHERRTR